MNYSLIRKRSRTGIVLAGTFAAAAAIGQTPATPQSDAPQPQTASATTTTGGTIHGTVLAGKLPLPGVSVTATNTLTGKKYATTTDVDGNYAMTIPRTGRYVVKAELAAFAPVTSEVRITAEGADQTAAFTLELASRAARTQAAGDSTAAAIASAIGRGTQALNITGDSTLSDASTGGANSGASLPSRGGIGAADSNGAATDSVAVSGQMGQTNGLAGFNEDQIRERIQDAMAQARQQGGAAGDQMNAVVSMIGGMMGGGGPGGGGGGRGGRGGGGGGFRGFNPTQPHGAFFYQGGFSALDAQAFSLTGTPAPKPNSYQNRFGASVTGSPGIPGLFKASTRQFFFLNVTGQRNITPRNLYGTVPTLAERGQLLNPDGSLANTDADLSGLVQIINGSPATPAIYNPLTANPYSNNIIPSAQITPQARALENYYPLPNVLGVTTRNYQTVTTQGSNTTNASARYVRNFGAAGFGGGGGGQRRNANAPLTLRQNINAAFSYSHTASDIRNIIPILGGKTSSDGYGLSTGYTVGYGRFNNNASLNWNRSHALTRNLFTYGASDPATAAGIAVPSKTAGTPRPGFYNGLPNISVTNFTGFGEQTPRDAINQTISFSDFISYNHKKHNFRAGLDIRRVHADQIGGNNVVGTFSFSGLVTESPQDQAATLNNTTNSTRQPATGSAFADFLLGQPQQTKIQAGLYKTYLRENVYDYYLQDDYRVAPGLTLNAGLRYEYFGPYTEKNNRLVNLDHNADFTVVDPVQPGGTGTFLGKYPTSLVNPDRAMYSPRLGVAWRPRFVKETVIRAGYGLNYNTSQYATFAQSLAFQPPFATTQNNVLSTAANQTGCVITQPGRLTNMTLANGFGCASKAIQNTYSVNKDYRLGHVQVYNLDIQRSLPHGVVVNLGYNGSRGGALDIVRSPNVTATTVTTPNAQAFTYEDSVAESRLNQAVISVRKRLEKGIAIQAVYQYGHSIDNASSIGGGSISQVQDEKRLDLEEGNSSFDVRHKLAGNFVLELPFGPNRAFLSKGGAASKILDGFGLSGDFTFASGTYFTPQYTGSAAQLAAGGTYTLRPDRVFTQPINGPRGRQLWFNKAAFAAPANGFGTASRNSIEGPGTVSINMSLGRTVSFGGTRSFEARMQATNVFNTVQYSGIDTTINSATFGQVTSTAQMRQIAFIGRYRF
jgi:hypothetical protein